MTEVEKYVINVNIKFSNSLFMILSTGKMNKNAAKRENAGAVLYATPMGW